MPRIPFIGRQAELDALNREWHRGNAFAVIYGRRRVGKTTLIKQFANDKPTLYFLASKENEEINRKRFATAVADFIDNELLAQAQFDDWRPIFRALADAQRNRPFVLAIDEFPYLITVNRAMPSIMQYAWDEILADSGAMLILCGSSISMMQDEVLAHESPLYGRRTTQMHIKPLSFSEVREAYPEVPFERVVETYALSGGVPKYLEFFNLKDSIVDNIRDNVLSTSGFLYEEPEFLLSEETRGSVNYLSLLRTVALGNRKSTEISTFLRRKGADLTPYIQTLISLGFLERRVPFNERYPDRSKNGLYYIADSFLLFWLTYVQPFQGELELDNVNPSLEAIRRTFSTSFVPFEFERISAETFARLCRTGDIPFNPSRISGYWNRTGSVELDVCALDTTDNRQFLGECKYYDSKPVGMSEYHALETKAELIPNDTGKQPLLGMFSHTSFSPELLELARANEQLVLVNCEARVA